MKSLLRTAAATVLVVLAACSQKPLHSSPEQTAAALDTITIDALQAHLEYLADDSLEGREAGQPGYDAAADYVVEQFKLMGVEPGGEDDWFQPVSLVRYKYDPESAQMMLHVNGEVETLVYRDDFSVYSDAVRTSNEVRGELVYIGYGVHAPEFGYSDYEGIDVRGKIVVGFSGAPEIIEGEERAYFASSSNKLAVAAERGAIGTISLSSRKGEKRRPWDEAKASFGKRWSMTWVNDAGEAARYYPEIQAKAAISPKTAEKLFGLSPLSYEQALDASEANEVASVALGTEITIRYDNQHETTVSPNVIGMVRGTDPELSNEYIVYTAHLDHVGVEEAGEDDEEGADLIHNGAYDNAMGVALMLETARAIALAPPKRSVLFIALTAEEKGLLGSDFFANSPTVDKSSLVANINLDMPLFLWPVEDLVAFGSPNSSLDSITADAASAEGFELSPDPVPEENLFVRSDQYSFVRAGIPAVWLVTGFKTSDPEIDPRALYDDHEENHYHEVTDDLTRPVDWPSALRFARAHTRIGFAIGHNAERPTWKEGDFFGEKYAPKK